MSEVRQWLEELGLGQYAEAFKENAIDGRVLPHLTEQDLRDMGVEAVGHRRLMLTNLPPSDATTGDTARATDEPVQSRDAERRQITVMFCDLVGSTALSEKLDPEDLRALMQEYQQTASAVIERYEGHVAQYLGDGLMTYFGWPQAHEDDAERAVRAALEVVEAVKAVAGGPETLQVRIGIATGPVVVGETGAGDASIPSAAVGETPNLAARMQGLANPGEVIIAPTTHRLVSGVFDYEERGGQSVKGVAEPVLARRVLGEAAVEGRFEAAHGASLTPLVGRETEITMLMERWRQACDGEGQVVLLSGEPGIGKSRITQTLRDRLADEPHTRLRYQCSPYHTNSALHPVIEQLERAAGFERDDDADAKLAKLEDLVGFKGTAPALFASILTLEPEERYPPLAMNPQKQKDETLQALSDQVSHLSEQQPVLMIFEDAHWIDPTSQEMLDLLVPQIAARKVLLVITYRPEYEPTWSLGLGHLSTLSLNRLGRKQASMMVEKVTGGKPLPGEVLDQIVAKTDGVPLFVEELTKTVIESGIVTEIGDAYELSGPLTELAIPSTIRDSLMARLDRLAPVKEVAQIGACIGREFSHELLAAVSPLNDNELNDTLQELVNSELIFRSGNKYTFKHALIQDTAYDSLLKRRRKQLHHEIATSLETQLPHTAEAQPEILAHHYGEAGETDPAITYGMRAARRAAERSANIEAVAHLRQALDHLAKLHDSEPKSRTELDIQLALAAQLIATKGYAAEETGVAQERALALWRELGDADKLVPALQGACANQFLRGHLREGAKRAEEMVREAEKQSDDGVRAIAHRVLGTCAGYMGNFSRGRAHLEKALSLYDENRFSGIVYELGTDPKAMGSSYLGFSMAALGFPERAVELLADGIAHARKINHAYTVASVTGCAAFVSYFLGDKDACASYTRTLESLSKEMGFPDWLSVATLCAAWAAVTPRIDGDLERAIGIIKTMRETQLLLNHPLILGICASACLDAGKNDMAAEMVENGLAAAMVDEERNYLAELHRLRANCHILKGEIERAEGSLDEALAVARGQQAKLWELRAATSLAGLWQSQGMPREAHDLLSPVYDWFTEGFDTADLKDAKALLDELK